MIIFIKKYKKMERNGILIENNNDDIVGRL